MTDTRRRDKHLMPWERRPDAPDTYKPLAPVDGPKIEVPVLFLPDGTPLVRARAQFGFRPPEGVE